VVGGDAGDPCQSCDDEPGDHPALRVDPEQKSIRARERNAAKRAAWREQTQGIDPRRFVWIDETGSHLGMTRRHSRAPRGQRASGTAPSSRGKNRTLITALTLDGIGPGLLLDEAIDYDTFDGYIIQQLAPTLTPGQIVVADNLSVHSSERARAAIEARGAHFWYLPPYSPDLNPIEEACSKVKTFLRGAEPRTLEDHRTAIWAALRTITPQDAAGWFAHAGYGTPRRRPPTRSSRRRPADIIRSTWPDAPRTITLQIPSGVAFDHLW
jgi:transposase